MRIPERSQILKDWLDDHAAAMWRGWDIEVQSLKFPTRPAHLAVTTFLMYSPTNFKLALIYDRLRSATIKLHQEGASM